jgi:hypothetical protein
MWRIFIRCAFKEDDTSAMENYLERLFDGYGITNSGTGMWECPATNAVHAAQVMGEMLRVLADPSQVTDVSRNFTLDHVWIYVARKALVA